MKKILLLCLLIGCGSNKKKYDQPVDPELSVLVMAKHELYLSLQAEALNEHGYAHDKCDSLGFTALCKAAGGCPKADLFASETEGQWFRSPEKDCFDKGESKSDFSKDMALMLFIHLNQLFATDPGAASAAIGRFRDYVTAHNYIMGRPSDNPEGISRVLMSPGLIATMQKLHAKLSPGLSGPTDSERDLLPLINKGFQAHLDVLGIWLDGELFGKINDIDKTVLEKQAERSPRNAIFQAVHHLYKDGDQTEVLKILADETLFPSDRLPKTSDRCEEYIFQRDDDDDWKPCPDRDETHDGVDFLMAGYLAKLW